MVKVRSDVQQGSLTSTMHKVQSESPMTSRRLRRIRTQSWSSQSCRIWRITYALRGPSGLGRVSARKKSPCVKVIRGRRASRAEFCLQSSLALSMTCKRHASGTLPNNVVLIKQVHHQAVAETNYPSQNTVIARMGLDKTRSPATNMQTSVQMGPLSIRVVLQPSA